MPGRDNSSHQEADDRPTDSARAAPAPYDTPLEVSPELSGIAADVVALGVTVAPARPNFALSLGARFEQAVEAATAGALQPELGAAGAERRPYADASVSLRRRPTAPRLRRSAPWSRGVAPRLPWSAPRVRWFTPGPRWVLPAAVTAVAVITVAIVTPRLRGLAPPPAIDRATLIERNAQAWSGLDTLSGAFETGDGWYFEEWISRAEGGALRFKRYIRPPARTPNRTQWNVSDGRTEWVIDAATGEVRVTREAVPGDFTAVAPNDSMQCTSLVLPATLADGPPPTPLVLDGRPVYRLVGPLADGSPAIFWVDAADSLVWRIDRPGLGTVWQRQNLSLDEPLGTDVFRPDSLANL